MTGNGDEPLNVEELTETVAEAGRYWLELNVPPRVADSGS